MKNLYECIVVGGGIAGSAAAYYLAQKGYNVVVLERTRGSHHKVCGEFLSCEALAYLNEIGITLNEDSPVIKRFHLFSPRSSAAFTLPRPGRGISRYKLDEDLLSKAGAAGARILRGICVTNVNKTKDLFSLETNADAFYARYLFIASGKHDCSMKLKRIGDTTYLGLKVHLGSLTEELKETIAFFSFPGGYGGVCPIENDTKCLSLIMDKRLYKKTGGTFQAALSFACRSNASLDHIVRTCHFTGTSYAVGHIPYGFIRRENGEEHLYFIGDQYAVIPSLTGDGMAIALATAKDCVRQFDGHGKPQRPPRLSKLPRTLKRQMRWALMAHAILRSPWLTSMAISISRFTPYLMRIIYQRTRICQSGSGL